MSELPRKAATVLALGKRAHDPDDATVLRVRARVAEAVAGDAQPAKDDLPAASPVKHAASRAFAPKLLGLGAAFLIGTGLYTALRAPAPRSPASDDSAPKLDTAPLVPREQTESAPVIEPRSSQNEPTDPPRAMREPTVRRATPSRHRSKPAANPEILPSRIQTDSLAEEVRLLKSSSAALDANEPARALEILRHYRATFAAPLLQHEHDGLRILARCALGKPGAVAQANALLAKDPTSVLRVKLIRLCRLNGAEP